MAIEDISLTAAQMIAGVEGSSAIVEILGSAGGFILREGAKIALAPLVLKSMESLGRKYREHQNDKKIPENYEQTEHGAAILQEALNALLQGLDKDRAEAVQKVFLGLAQNPVENSLARVQQLEIIRATSTLTTWEVTLINLLERFQGKVAHPPLQDDWEKASTCNDQTEISRIKSVASDTGSNVKTWLNKKCKDDPGCMPAIIESFDTLKQKRILAFPWSNHGRISEACVFNRKGAFTEFGWQLVVHLYSATDAVQEHDNRTPTL